MAYSVKNTRNVEVDTVTDGTVKTTTFGIRIPGKNYTGYGEAIAQSLLHILENHAAPNSGADTPNASNPNVDMSAPVDGQLWYDTTNKKLRVWDSGDASWNISSGAAAVAPTSSPPSSPANGDLWWNTTTEQLLGYDGTGWVLIGPIGTATDPNKFVNLQINVGGTGGLSSGVGTSPTAGTNNDAIGVLVNNVLVGVWSNTAIASITYYHVPLNDGTGNSEYYSFDPYGTAGILKGLNVGENTSAYWLNGKAAAATTADQLSGTTATNFVRNDNGAGASTSRVPTTASLDFGTGGSRWGTMYATTFDGTASAAQYSDLAERYESDMQLEEGDVVRIGGAKEITKTNVYGDTDVFGVVSRFPGFAMNEGAGDNNTHPYVALSGRIPVKVTGTVNKGDRLVASEIPGVAQAGGPAPCVYSVIGRALESKTTEEVGLVEVVVGKN